MYSVIIPTMWVNPTVLFRMLDVYGDHPLIGEVLLINNNDSGDIPVLVDKVRMIGNGINKYVNPSWNYGVSLAKYNKIIIANDDIFIRDFSLLMDMIDAHLKPGDVIGVHNTCYSIKNKYNVGGFAQIKPRILPARVRNWGWGTFMVLHKKDYVHIPDEYKIWYGDDFQFNKLRPFAFVGIRVETKMSETIDSNHKLSALAVKDMRLYEKRNRRKP